MWVFTWRVSDWWRHLREHLGINATNYFMYRWAGPVRPPPHSSCSGRSCLMKLQKSPMNRQQILPQQWLNSKPEFKKNKSSMSSVSKIWWFPPIPDLNRTKKHNKTQTSDFHQSSLRKKTKIPVKITPDTLNPSKYSRIWILILLYSQ